MKVCVVGAGAIGGLFAGWLGHRIPAGEIELSALARGATLAALHNDGLLLEGDEPTRVALRASDDARELGAQDLIVVAVKGPALRSVANAIAAMLAPQTIVLVAMNGVPWWFFEGSGGPCAGLQLQSVDPDGALRAAIPLAHVIGCVVHASSSAPRPGVVRHVMGNRLVIGEPRGGRSARVAALESLLARAGFAATVSENIQRDIWFKLWGNMTMNPVSALTGATCDRILDDPLVRGFCSAVMLEAQQIGARIGCAIEQTPEQRHAVTRKLGAFKTSMLQDLEAGRALEIDALVGAVREIGQHLGLATPNIDALLGLVRLLAQVHGC
ncbi:MAG TPA: 2-dehydropantoate 2-reductase [Albitalea sp.]|nr:2-dehydropantoate 2-reductase [Albitalea sp.]